MRTGGEGAEPLGFTRLNWLVFPRAVATSVGFLGL